MTPFTSAGESTFGADAEAQPPRPSPVESCPHCGVLVDTTELEPLETISCPGCGNPFVVYRSIESYQLLGVAGEGGMGVVYKAYDPSLDRCLAIKLLRKRHSSDRRLIEQLAKEARMTASIADPNVVRVFGTGFDRGRFYIAMELVEHGSLDEVIRDETRVSEMRVLLIGIQIAKGLKAANRLGLIHRDVKPGNILFGDANMAKIVDFGLALFMSEVDDSNTEIWGTPYYLAPEKLDGGAEDFRSDIYSLGGTLFHALAGRPPFEAQTPTMVALKHLKSQAVSLQAFAPWVSKPTAHIINKTLSKNPSDRYASYDEFIQNMEYALEQLLAGEITSPSSTRMVLETDEDRKQWSWVVLSMAAVIVALLVGAFVVRPKSKTDPLKASATATAKSPSFERELKALILQDEQAAAMFKTFAARESASATDRAWALVLEGTAHLLAGRGFEAKGAFESVVSAAGRMKDQDVAEFLKQTSQQIVASGTIPATDVLKLDHRNHQAIGLFLHGLNAWFNGSPEDSTALLREFQRTAPEPQYAWIAGLQPLAARFVDDITTFRMKSETFQKARTTEERIAAAGALRRLGPAFTAKVEALISPYVGEIADYQEAAPKTAASSKTSSPNKTAKVRKPNKAPELGKTPNPSNLPVFGITSEASKAPEIVKSPASRPFPSPGVYRIVNKQTNKCIDGLPQGRKKGCKVVQSENDGGANQMWELIPRNDGTVSFRSIHSGLFLDLPHGTIEANAPIHLWPGGNTVAMKWRLEPKEGPWFSIRSEASSQVLGLLEMNPASRTPITQEAMTGSADQLWRFEFVGERIGEWVSADVGDVAAAGETLLKENTLTMTGQTGDVWGDRDSFRYTFQEVVGDFDFSARIAEVSKNHDYSKVGLMVRGGAVPGEATVFVVSTLAKGGARQIRATAGSRHSQVKDQMIGPPCWLKLTRRGETFTTYYSKDGVTWAQVASDPVPGIIKEATVGVAVSSNNNQPFTAKVDQIKLTQP
jgi:eukaryotic-like serine/threonine-protein kinase